MVGSLALADKPPTRKGHPPRASAIPAGVGWHCVTATASGMAESSLCAREASDCEGARENYLKGGYQAGDCREIDYAACFTYRNKLQDRYYGNCSASFVDCDAVAIILRNQRRDYDDISDCARTK